MPWTVRIMKGLERSIQTFDDILGLGLRHQRPRKNLSNETRDPLWAARKRGHPGADTFQTMPVVSRRLHDNYC